jgi:phenylalanyl-tRNA synthetase beta chain
MQTKLRAAGVRPINVLVDITNYVMMEVGQPMHVFDALKLAKGKEQKAIRIAVRKAKEGETLKALDGKEYKLTKGMLVIADSEQPLAIAGVMGGEASGVISTTTSVIYEAATFDAVSIRKTSTALGLRSDSSTRFEKSLPPEHAEIALKKAVELTLALVPGARVASVVVDKKVPVKKRAPIVISLEVFAKKLGTSVKTKEIGTILTHLGFGVRASRTALTLTVPPWRVKDIAIAEDVIEEIARVYGYEKIPVTLPAFPIQPPAPNALKELERSIRELLAYEHGFTEMYNYSFISGEQIEQLGLAITDHLELENPGFSVRRRYGRSLATGFSSSR